MVAPGIKNTLRLPEAGKPYTHFVFHSFSFVGWGQQCFKYRLVPRFGTFVTSAHAACPMPLQKAQPDRFAEV
jgi:hypothetical protein